jgi:3-methyladenine DNA glycosylase AlkD
MSTPSLQDFEIKFKDNPVSSLKDCSTSDYQESSYTILGYRAHDIKSFQYPPYNQLPSQAQFEFLNTLIIHSQISEVVTWALYKVEECDSNELINNKRMLINWSYTIGNWWHCDQLSSIYNTLLSSHKIFFKDLQSLNTFSSAWQRRLSITSLYYYAKLCKNPIPLKMAIPLVEKLLLDTNYYVQKGIGWTLREMSQIDYNETLTFMRIHAKHIPTAGFSASIEKLHSNHKNELKQLRKKEESNPYEFRAHEDESIQYHHLKHHHREN